MPYIHQTKKFLPVLFAINAGINPTNNNDTAPDNPAGPPNIPTKSVMTMINKVINMPATILPIKKTPLPDF
jgi:hypothetical protein